MKYRAVLAVCFLAVFEGLSYEYTVLARDWKEPVDSARKKVAPYRQKEPGTDLWQRNIPITGKAMAMAGNVLLIVGEPVEFEDRSHKTYAAAYNGELGGQLVALSATDGTILLKYPLEAAPAWDGIAVADGQVYISLADGTVQCFGK
jgi:outer membrane protein assembly factor BamB